MILSLGGSNPIELRLVVTEHEKTTLRLRLVILSIGGINPIDLRLVVTVLSKTLRRRLMFLTLIGQFGHRCDLGGICDNT